MMLKRRLKAITAAVMTAILLAMLCNVVGAMQILVRVASSESTMELEVKPEDTVGSVKESIKKMTGVPTEQQVLSKGGYELENEKTLKDYKINEGNLLELTVEKKAQSDSPEETTEMLTPDQIDGDGEIIIGSLIVNSSNIKIVSYVAGGIVVVVIAVLIYVKKKS